MKVTIEKAVTRKAESWAFIYFALAITLGIEAAIIALFPWGVWNIAIMAPILAFTAWAVLSNAWVQNKLIGFKSRNENKARRL